MNSGRLNLCPKTRELTDKLPRYSYGRRSGESRRNGNTEGDDDDDDCRKRGSRGGGGGGSGSSYRDAGDRLYSEWVAARGRKARRRERENEARQGGATGGGGVASSGEAWSCPKCGGENR